MPAIQAALPPCWCGDAGGARILPAGVCCQGWHEAFRDGLTMTDDAPEGEEQTETGSKNAARQRLKQALRENLRRRKAQARGRGEIAAASSNRDEPSPHPGSGKKPDE
jgi:hypothetical protein